MSSAKLNRRKFIRYTAAIGGGVEWSPALHIPAAAEGNTQRSIYWYQQPLPILQTVLWEPDASNCNAKAVAYMAKTGCNTLVVNGGGIVDFFQNQSSWYIGWR